MSKPNWSGVIELGLLLLAVLIANDWPTFAFANRIDSDEFLKVGAGAGTTAGVAAVFVAYKLWSARHK